MKDETRVNRRTLIRFGVDGLLALGSLVLLGAGFLRATYPRIFPGGRPKVKIGPAGEFSPGTAKYFEDGRFFVFGDADGIWALSAICTHLGCTVRQSGKGFTCPCHGSRFDATGAVTHGPAPKRLPWLAINALPDGTLLVDAGRTSAPGKKVERKA